MYNVSKERGGIAGEGECSHKINLLLWHPLLPIYNYILTYMAYTHPIVFYYII